MKIVREKYAAHKNLYKNRRHDVLKYVIMSLMALCGKQSGEFTLF